MRLHRSQNFCALPNSWWCLFLTHNKQGSQIQFLQFTNRSQNIRLYLKIKDWTRPGSPHSRWQKTAQKSFLVNYIKKYSRGVDQQKVPLHFFRKWFSNFVKEVAFITCLCYNFCRIWNALFVDFCETCKLSEHVCRFFCHIFVDFCRFLAYICRFL